MNTRAEKQSLAILYFIYFCDSITWGATIPFAALYISAHIPIAAKSTALIGALAAFPMGQLFGSPILGDFSDWLGRRQVLLWSMVGTVVSLMWAGFALMNGAFLNFLIAEVFVGFFAGKLSLLQAALSELPLGMKGQKFAALSIFAGLPSLFGPFLGSLLFQYGIYANPCLLGAGMFVLAFFAALIYFHDTYFPQNRHLSVVSYLKSFKTLFSFIWKEKTFLPFILNSIGWYLAIIFLSPFLLLHLQLGEEAIGIYNSYLGLSLSVGGVLAAKWIFGLWSPVNILRTAIPIFAIAIFLLFATATPLTLWPLLACAGAAQASIFPAFMTLLSDRTSSANQGKMFGLLGMSNGACHFIALSLFTQLSSGIALLLGAFFSASCFMLLRHLKYTGRGGF